MKEPLALDLLSVVDHLVRRSIWIVGGDGWAYDIGYGGLDHVLASARDVNVLVLDTEVYSNTGGQASKATPLGAVAKFAASGKRTARKDLALQAIAYGNVYVAQVAMGANPQHTLQAFREAEAYDGPSLILAYSHCIAHGIDMRFGMKQQDLAAASGYWPLFRFNPMMRTVGENPFRLDLPRPRIPLKAYAYNELRYSSLANSRPEEADMLLTMAQAAVTEKYRQYEELASRDGSRFHPDARVQAQNRRHRRSAGGSCRATAREACSCAWRIAHPRESIMLLATKYLGLELKNPLVASASPLNSKLDNLRRLEDAGAAAIVLPSLFQEQIEAEAETLASRVDVYAESSPEAASYFPPAVSGPYGVRPDRYLELVRRAKEALAHPRHRQFERIVARRLDRSCAPDRAGRRGGAGTEHVSCPGRSDGIRPRRREPGTLKSSQAVCESITLPVAIKLTPFLSSLGHFAATLVEHGAGGLVLVQPHAGARHRSFAHETDRPSGIERARRDASADALDRDPFRAHQGIIGRFRRRIRGGGCREIPARRGRCGDDDLGVVAVRYSDI